MMKPRVVLVALPVLLAGCVHATFVKTDPSFAPRDRTSPAVYVDHLPSLRYRSVGIIEVTSPASTALGDVLQAAAEKGAELGCDVVVDRSIHRVMDAGAVLGVVRLVQYAPAPMYYAPPPSKREFVCGVVESDANRPAPAGI